MGLLDAVAGLLLMCVVACGQSALPPAITQPVAPQPAKPRVADFVICIDNSASITPAEQDIIRETLMLLTDLAGIGDRLAIVRFGEKAHVGVPVEIRGDSDRQKVKDYVRSALDFRERYSDIRAAVRAISDNQDRLFRPPGASVRVPIIVSDGKLEPPDGNVGPAVKEIRSIVRGPLAQSGMHAIVTGNTRCHDEILPGLTGLALMEREIARTPDRFFHAASLDQLLDAAVLILRRAKGISSLGEEKQARFKIDSTVEALTIIVRKRSLAGEVLCTAEEIRLKHRMGTATPETLVTFANHEAVMPGAVYWTDDYQHFDLIVIRQPLQGIWSVELASGRSPQVLSKIDTPVDLRVNSRPFFYANESAFITAAVYDRQQDAVVRRPYKIEAFLPGAGVYSEFRADAATGTYVLEVPAAFLPSLPGRERPGTVDLEVIAQLRTAPGSADLDPWFVRRSPQTQIRVVEPIARWGNLPERPTAVVGDVRLDAAVTLDLRRPGAPEFESTPQVSLTVDHWDDRAQTYRRLATQTLAASPRATQVRYAGTLTLHDAGTYRYAYRLAGSTKLEGPFVLDSPAYGLRLVSYRLYVGLGGVLLIVGVFAWISSATATMNGQMMVDSNRGHHGLVRLARAGVYVSGPDLDKVDMGSLRFRLRARRVLFFWSKRIAFTLVLGAARVDGLPLKAGGTRALKAGPPHRMVFTRDDGVEVTLTLNLSI